VLVVEQELLVVVALAWVVEVVVAWVVVVEVDLEEELVEEWALVVDLEEEPVQVMVEALAVVEDLAEEPVQVVVEDLGAVVVQVVDLVPEEALEEAWVTARVLVVAWEVVLVVEPEEAWVVA
jgi:hypothetical protein